MVVGETGRLPLPWLDAPLLQALGIPKAHAVLLHAAAGDGALQLAMTLAQSWLCEAAPIGAPLRQACGRCGSCRQVATRAHPDLRCLLPESLQLSLGWLADDAEAAESGKARRKPSRQILIQAVRSAIDWTATSSSRGRGKVVLIHPAEVLNPQAANALLKTLEEPPRGTRLILSCADPEALLPTVRSRCQRVRLPAPTLEAARDWLASEHPAMAAADAHALLRAVDGHPLDAAARTAQGLSARSWAALPAAVAAGRAGFFSDWPPAQVVDALHRLCHDEMALAVGGSARYFDRADLLGSADLSKLLAWKSELDRVARQVEHPWSESLLVEALLATASAALTTATQAAFDTLRG